MLKILTEQVEEKKGRYLSWSAAKNWDECPYYYKLTKIDDIGGFEGNVHTAFGHGVHWTIEKELTPTRTGSIDLAETFTENFNKALGELPEEQKKLLSEEPKTMKLHDEMKLQGRELVPFLKPALDEYFGEWELVGIEEKFYEKCNFYDLGDFFFKGFIDIVVKTKDGKFHIVDWKTCSWGWDVRKKSDPMVTYQLTVYKHFFCQKYGIKPSKVETHFALCKRTNKTNKRVEFFKVTSGPKKTANALNFLKRVVYNVDHNNHLKNRSSCYKKKKCEFRHTKHCL